MFSLKGTNPEQLNPFIILFGTKAYGYAFPTKVAFHKLTLMTKGRISYLINLYCSKNTSKKELLAGARIFGLPLGKYNRYNQ